MGWALLFLMILISAEAAAAPSEFLKVQGTASMLATAPSAFGGRIFVSGLVAPVPEKSMLVGPRLAYTYVSGSGTSRSEFNLGVGQQLWLLNFIATGLNLDYVAAKSISPKEEADMAQATRFQVEPVFLIRFKRFGDEGAWTMWLGAPYDTHYKWGAELGLMLQFNGVP